MVDGAAMTSNNAAGVYEYGWLNAADSALGAYEATVVAVNSGNVLSSMTLDPAFNLVRGM